MLGFVSSALFGPVMNDILGVQGDAWQGERGAAVPIHHTVPRLVKQGMHSPPRCVYRGDRQLCVPQWKRQAPI